LSRSNVRLEPGSDFERDVTAPDVHLKPEGDA
jgi:hypothetical protein